MIEGFDKEIDALLRQTAKGEGASAMRNQQPAIINPKFAHLDADEISAYAENALPEKLRQKYTAHFADCDRCRTILSNTIALNSEAENVSVSSATLPETVKSSKIPWYKQIFAFPGLAYTLGALVILLGGFLAFSILQKDSISQNAEVSQISEDQPKASGPSYESEPNFSTSSEILNTNTTSVNSGTETMMSNSSMSGSSTVNPSNTSTSMAVNNATGRGSSVNSSSANTSLIKREMPLNETKREAKNDSEDNENVTKTDVTTADSAAGVSTKQVSELPLTQRNLQTISPAPPAALAKPEEREREANKDASLAKKRATTPTVNVPNRQISGKTFNRRENVWYDTDYKGQSTTNVSRASNEYKELDSGLRSIAGNLGGTVVVVWKGKAYRIQ